MKLLKELYDLNEVTRRDFLKKAGTAAAGVAAASLGVGKAQAQDQSQAQERPVPEHHKSFVVLGNFNDIVHTLDVELNKSYRERAFGRHFAMHSQVKDKKARFQISIVFPGTKPWANVYAYDLGNGTVQIVFGGGRKVFGREANADMRTGYNIKKVEKQLRQILSNVQGDDW